MWLERLYDEFTQGSRMSPATFLVITLVTTGILAFVVGTAITAMTGQTSVLALALGFFLLTSGAIALVVVGLSARDRKPAGADLSCPRCGAPPTGSASAYGLTKCANCGDAYFVR